MNLGQYDDHVELARQQLAAGNARQSALILSVAAAADSLPYDDRRMRTFREVLAMVAEGMDLAGLVQAARAAADDSPQSMYLLGRSLNQVGLPQIAIPVLRRVDALQVGSHSVVMELCTAHELAGQHFEIVELLRGRSVLLRKFWFRYLLCFHAVCVGRLDIARHYVEDLDPVGDDQVLARTRVRGMLGRADAVLGMTSLDRADLRGWHFVMNGGTLLHLSPWGFEDGMHGRYAFLVDDVAEIRVQLDRLVAVLAAVGWAPVGVSAAPDRGSRLVGSALAQLLSCPFGEPTEGGLGVVYELDEHGTHTPPPDGRLFARGVRWTPPPTVVPHYVGLLHQILQAPWDDDENGAVDDATWIQRILEAEEAPDPEPAGVLALWDPLETVLAMAQLDPTPADRWFDGPVAAGRI